MSSDKIKEIQWQTVLNSMTQQHQKLTLARVLRTRKRLLNISLNGRIQWIPRNIVRDFLKEKHPEVGRDYTTCDNCGVADGQ